MPIDITKLSLEEILDLKKQLGQAKFRAVNGQGRKPTQRLIDLCATWDWTKSNNDLSSEHGVPYCTVAKRRSQLGYEPVKKTKFWPACKAWDWTKSDTEISRETGAATRTVYLYRLVLNKPSVGPVYDRLPPLLASVRFDYTSLDWSKPDIILARKSGRTRERIRQVRAQLGKPKTLSHHFKFNECKKLLEANPKMTFEEIKAVVPICHQSYVYYCRRLGIEVMKRQYTRKYAWGLLNFDLPNNILAEIWKCKGHTVAAHRCNYHLQQPAFRYVTNGKRLCPVPASFLPVVKAEREKAEVYFASKKGS